MTTATMPQPTAAGWSAWLTMARVSNTPTVVSNVLAGAALARGSDATIIVLVALAMVLFYTAGMLLNDLCDYRWDQSHRPDRPLVTGTVSRQAALVATIALFVIGGALLAIVSPRAVVAGLILIGFIVLYDTWHKTNPLSPLVMGACRVMVYVTAFVSFLWPPTLALAVGSVLLLLYLVGLTALAKRGAGANVVAGLIAGISLLDALIIIAVGGSWLWVGVAVVAFGLTLLLQRYVEGT